MGLLQQVPGDGARGGGLRLIPLCHPIALTRVAVEFEVLTDQHAVRCTATAETTGPTGVEMEALTAVQVALLTIYGLYDVLSGS